MKKVIFFLLLSISVYAEDSTKKASVIRCVHPQISMEIPTGLLAQRFGPFTKLGVGYTRKTKKNLLYGGRVSFIVGGNVREDSLLSNILLSDGSSITGTGLLGNFGIFQRGYELSVNGGKIWNIKKRNLNSGIYWNAAVGFNQHKIKFFDADKRYTYFSNGYYKGYDRLTNGLFTTQQIGYIYFHPDKPINFNVGLQGSFAMNEGRRDWLFDVQRSGLDKRNEFSLGLFAGWIISIYKREAEEKFY